MQRRAAAVYVAVFMLVAAGSYGVIATAQAPHVDLPSSAVDHETVEKQSFTVDGTEYTVSKIETSGGGGGGGHGGGGEATTSATIKWNATVTKTQMLQNGSAVQYQGANWTVHIANESGVSSFRLVENFTITEPTVTQDGTTYVVLEGEGNNRTLVPKDEYLRTEYGEPRTLEFAEGDTWNETTGATVSNVTRERVLVTRQAVESQSTSVSEGGNVTLANTTYTAHFPDDKTLQLTTDYGAYRADKKRIERFHDRKNGLWYVTSLSGFGGVLLLALAYLPNKGD